MLKKYILITFILLAMIFQSMVASSSVYYFALFLPILMLATLMIVIIQEKNLVRLCFGLCLLFALVWMVLRFSEPTFSHSFYTMLCCILCFFAFEHRWNKKVVLAETHRKLMAIAAGQIEEQVKEKDGELKKLEKHVSEIIELFESAKFLNATLDYHEIAQSLKTKVLQRLEFKSAELVILDESSEEAQEWLYFNFSHDTIDEEKKPKQSEINHLMELAKRRVANLKIDSEASEEAKNISIQNYPCWIFPLYVEDILLGVFKVEKPLERDLQKFSILATQVALQIKKIKLYETVKQLAITDGLTRTFVRRYFLERFVEEIKRSIKYQYHLSVLMIDIDHFKQYNDFYGHLVGDVTLKEVAQQIRATIRKVDILSRYGGEEFAVVLPETELQGALEAAERIRSGIARRRFRVYDEQTEVTVSIGVAVFPKDLSLSGSIHYEDEMPLELLKIADQALYRAKEEGRNRIVH